jgi:large subunit ribosomal protein L10
MSGRDLKENLISELVSIASASQGIVFTHYHGLTVKQVTELRRKLRKSGANFKIIKNTLAKIAFKKAQLNFDELQLKGPVAIAYSEDPITSSKVVVEFAKTNKQLKVVGGVVNNISCDADGIDKISKLPSLDEIRGQLIGLISAPATKIARVIAAPASQIVTVLKAYSEKE